MQPTIVFQFGTHKGMFCWSTVRAIVLVRAFAATAAYPACPLRGTFKVLANVPTGAGDPNSKLIALTERPV